ncbi:MAG: hypothetical protein ACE5KK_06480 [Candidatus Brocadiales bacterium]
MNNRELFVSPSPNPLPSREGEAGGRAIEIDEWMMGKTHLSHLINDELGSSLKESR